MYGSTLALWISPRPFHCPLTLKGKQCRICEHLNTQRTNRLAQLVREGVAARTDQHLWNQANHDYDQLGRRNNAASATRFYGLASSDAIARDCGCVTCKRYLELIKRRDEARAQL